MRTLLLLLIACVAFARTYSTAFPATENPISESSNWSNAGVDAGASWGNVQTSTNLAFGVSLPTTYGDPTAVVTGTWGADQTVEATVKINTTPAVCCHEVELRLRTTFSTDSNNGYELLCPVHASPGYGYQIVRWNGAAGDYVYIGAGVGTAQCVQGDVIKGTVSGTNPVTINFYVNDELVATACDNGQASGGSCGGVTYTGPGGAAGPFTSGKPGIGFYGEVNWNYFGFSAFSATDGIATEGTKITGGTVQGGTVQ